MTRVRLISLSFLGVAVLAAGWLASSSMSAFAAGSGDYTCTGGSIPGGTYSSLTVTGTCALDSGSLVTVQHNATVRPGGILIAAFGGSDLTVNGNLHVQAGGALVLGCEPEAFICFNDPDQDTGTMATNDVIGGNLSADHALALLLHYDTIHGNLNVAGGGGGDNCDPQDALFGSPAYATLEDSVVGGNVGITNWQSCWFGMFRNTVSGNVNFHNNVTEDPDGNEIATNVISGNLNCTGNSPATQFGDSEGSPNTVSGHTNGQCTAVVGP